MKIILQIERLFIRIMITIFSKKCQSSSAQSQRRMKWFFAIVWVVTTFVLMNLVIKNSLRSKLTYLNKDTILNSEIAISYFQRDIRRKFSKFQCTGQENNIESWHDRLCIFRNICYNNDAHRFEYFRFSQKRIKPIFYDSSKGMLFQFSKHNDSYGFLSLTVGGGTPWTPVIVNETYPAKNIITLSHLHTLMRKRYADTAIGHALWEEFGSISYSMERLNIVDRKLVIMHLGAIPKTGLFRLYEQYIVPALTEYPLIEFETYIKSFNTKYVCFENLIVGGQLLVAVQSLIRENHGREALFYNWRSKIIRHNGFDPNFVPRRHHITITNKSFSIWATGGTTRHRAIVNLKEVEKFIRINYPTISTEVIEWHSIPFKKQIEKILSTTILITPCGGVSMLTPLLPHGAHAIIMDYYVTEEAHGFKRGQSASMDGALMNHFPHVRKQYYQVYGPQDYEFDFPGTNNTREHASTVINMTRLQLLIDKALEEMEP